MDDNHSLCLKIDFEKDSQKPERVFKTMARLIENVEDMQDKLSFSLSTSIKRNLLLKEIETGSLLTWLTADTECPTDESEIRVDPENDNKIKKYLTKGVAKIVDFSSSRNQVDSIEEVTNLQEELYFLAEEADIKNIPAYTKIPEKDLLEILLKSSDASKLLSSNDDIFFTLDGVSKKYNRDFSISKESIENILTKDTVEDDVLLELGIKKPDYIGNSMWEFIHEKKIIEAKLLHETWLKEFRDRKVTLKPGDSLEALVRVTKFYNHRAEEINKTYVVLEVKNIIKQPFQNTTIEMELKVSE